MMDEELYREMIEEHEREEVESLQLLPDLKVSQIGVYIFLKIITPPPFFRILRGFRWVGES